MSTNDLVALRTVKSFNDLARRAAAKGSETLALIWKAGEVAKQAKESLPHGGWMPFVETHYDVNHSTVCRWIQFRDTVPESKLCTVQNLTAGIKMLEPPKEEAKPASSTPPKPPPPPPEADPDDDEDAPESPAEQKPPPSTQPQNGNGTPPKQYPRSHWLRQWELGIGPLVRLVDKIAEGVGERRDPHHEAIQERLEDATEEMTEWMRDK